MKYFTRGLIDGEHDDAAYDLARDAYRQSVADIWSTMPEGLRLLFGVSLHDAIIDRVKLSDGGRHLSIALVAALSEGSFSTVSIAYSDVMLGPCRLAALRRVAMSREACVLEHEVGLKGGILSHRYLFWPSDELTVDCGAVVVSIEQRTDDRVWLGGSFVEC